MKKAVFTIQMIALIAMFPVYLITELNHETAELPVQNSTSGFKAKAEEKNVSPVLNSEQKGKLLLLPETVVIN